MGNMPNTRKWKRENDQDVELHCRSIVNKKKATLRIKNNPVRLIH